MGESGFHRPLRFGGTETCGQGRRPDGERHEGKNLHDSRRHNAGGQGWSLEGCEDKHQGNGTTVDVVYTWSETEQA